MRRRPALAAAAVVLAAGAGAALAAVATTGAEPAARHQAAGQVSEISGACLGRNAEVEQAVNPARHLIFELWIGCGGIGFARSVDGGHHFQPASELPGSGHGWDPAIAVGRTGTVYASFMLVRDGRAFPVVAASFDNGRTFPQVTRLVPAGRGNFGDRDFIAVGPTGTIYLTWDYGPIGRLVRVRCPPHSSCYFTAGDLNIVLQSSVDDGRTWSKIRPVSPAFPAGGADSAPLLVQPGGRIDVLYQGLRVLDHRTPALGDGHCYFTASGDAGRTWSDPVRLGPSWPAVKDEWWIDGALSTDSAGNLYATWDTQTGSGDVGWLAYSTTGGRTWSVPARVTPDNDRSVHIVQVAAGSPGTAVVGWLTDDTPAGYAVYLRPFSMARGWLSAPTRVSRGFGSALAWPGDTIGISLYRTGLAGPSTVALSWGSAVGGPAATSQIYATQVTIR